MIHGENTIAVLFTVNLNNKGRDVRRNRSECTIATCRKPSGFKTDSNECAICCNT